MARPEKAHVLGPFHLDAGQHLLLHDGKLNRAPAQSGGNPARLRSEPWSAGREGVSPIDSMYYSRPLCAIKDLQCS